jgi:hypothetical protein
MKIKQMQKSILALFLALLSYKISFSQTSKTYTFDTNQLSSFWATSFMIFNIIYPDTTHPYFKPPTQEIVLSLNEEFNIELNNCSLKDKWECSIEDSMMRLIQCDTMLIDSNESLTYKFSASKTCKGCIVFIGDSRELIIEYTCNPVISLDLNLTHQDWFIDTSDSFSTLGIYLSGQTNACKLKIENYGDGLLSAATIYPNNNGNFSDTVGIAFSYDPMHQHIPINNTRIALYGSIGLPKILTILYSNPTSINEINITQMQMRYDLYQNYPNPFNPSTTISFYLPIKSFVTLKVFDMLGREVALLINQELPAGNHIQQWTANTMASGIYFYYFRAGLFTQTKKLVLSR